MKSDLFLAMSSSSWTSLVVMKNYYKKNDVICMIPLYGTVECYQTSDVKIKSSKKICYENSKVKLQIK